MLRRAAQFISRASFHIYAPGLAIALTVLAFNALGDSLRDALDPVASNRKAVNRAARRSRRHHVLRLPEAGSPLQPMVDPTPPGSLELPITEERHA
jgi:hypothetical protein